MIIARTTMTYFGRSVLGICYSYYISTALIAVVLIVYELASCHQHACGGCRFAFGLLFQHPKFKFTAKITLNGQKSAAVPRTVYGDGSENVRDIRTTNQEERYLDELNKKIDAHERIMIKGDFTQVFL